MSLTIIDPGLSFISLTPRQRTTYIIIHHTASENTSVQEIHNWHLANGWAGIGYNFYIRKDGTIYKGRGWEYQGSHAGSLNSSSLGIGFEGNYETTSTYMPDAQFNAGVALIIEALERYPSITTIFGHREFMATACPGRYFPLEELEQLNYRI